jgi:hypothetical protein
MNLGGFMTQFTVDMSQLHGLEVVPAAMDEIFTRVQWAHGLGVLDEDDPYHYQPEDVLIWVEVYKADDHSSPDDHLGVPLNGHGFGMYSSPRPEDDALLVRYAYVRCSWDEETPSIIARDWAGDHFHWI